MSLSNSQIVTDSERLNQGIESKFNSNIYFTGSIEFPCLPSMLDVYLDKIETIVKTLGKDENLAQLDFLRFMLIDHLYEGFAKAPDTCLKITLTMTGKDGFQFKIDTYSQSLDQRYQEWIDKREPPLFGEYPDAKVMDVAQNLGLTSDNIILDIGAGTGRNTIALAQKSYQVDAVELTSVFAQQLIKSVQSENLSVKVIQSNIIDGDFALTKNYYNLAIASEVISTHIRNIDDLRQILGVICDVLKDQGLFLFDLFMPINKDYVPDQKVREIGQLNWCYILTESELNEVLTEFPLEIISNESAIEYEQKNQPDGAFPRNSWFTSWSEGRNIFALLEDEKPP
ncbi:MAG: class I SAM-dependent methyltransferase, partial [Synechococcus sp.]|nr:class I SAM-dependent methyltransferase [Synechococcus sp.]